MRSGTGDANNHATTYNYDEAGRLTSILDAKNQTSRYAYDDAGNLVQVQRLSDRSSPSSPVYLSTFFAYQNTQFPHYITSITDPRGVVAIRNDYDSTG